MNNWRQFHFLWEAAHLLNKACRSTCDVDRTECQIFSADIKEAKQAAEATTFSVVYVLYACCCTGRVAQWACAFKSTRTFDSLRSIDYFSN